MDDMVFLYSILGLIIGFSFGFIVASLCCIGKVNRLCKALDQYEKRFTEDESEYDSMDI